MTQHIDLASSRVLLSTTMLSLQQQPRNLGMDAAKAGHWTGGIVMLQCAPPIQLTHNCHGAGLGALRTINDHRSMVRCCILFIVKGTQRMDDICQCESICIPCMQVEKSLAYPSVQHKSTLALHAQHVCTEA